MENQSTDHLLCPLSLLLSAPTASALPMSFWTLLEAATMECSRILPPNLPRMCRTMPAISLTRSKPLPTCSPHVFLVLTNGDQVNQLVIMLMHSPFSVQPPIDMTNDPVYLMFQGDASKGLPPDLVLVPTCSDQPNGGFNPGHA